jgi:uncharacterized RDD family membrane protein YckC/Tfp pilus assembly major pilin PilA
MSGLAPLPQALPLYAGFWRRAAAWSLDGLIVLIPNVLVGWDLGQGELGIGVSVLVALAYYAGFHSSPLQATPGKLALRIKVTGLQGERIGVLRAIVRYFSTWLSAIILGLGYLLAATTAKRQALHDMIAATLVVNRKAAPEDVAAGGGVMPITAGVMLAIVLIVLLPFVGGVVAAVAIPAYQDYVTRAKVATVLAYGAPLKAEVEKALRENQVYQGSAAAPLPNDAQSVEVSERGEIVLTLAPSVAGGGKIVLTPTRDAAGKTTWDCQGEDLAPRFLPQSCRK